MLSQKPSPKKWHQAHITVNAIACGAVDTEMNGHLNDDERAARMDEIPACRMASADEVGQMVLSLLNAPEYRPTDRLLQWMAVGARKSINNKIPRV